MDKFTRQILEAQALGMIGKSERGPIAIEAIKDNTVYLMAVGAAYLVAQAIKKCWRSPNWAWKRSTSSK